MSVFGFIYFIFYFICQKDLHTTVQCLVRTYCTFCMTAVQMWQLQAIKYSIIPAENTADIVIW